MEKKTDLLNELKKLEAIDKQLMKLSKDFIRIDGQAYDDFCHLIGSFNRYYISIEAKLGIKSGRLPF